jgi:hypothetical protein
MNTLRSNHFSLVLGDLVVAKVRAINERGAGNFSNTNSDGALVEVIPMAPANSPFRGNFTSET